MEKEALLTVGEDLVRKAFEYGYRAGRDDRDILPDDTKAYEDHKHIFPKILRDFLKVHYSNEINENALKEHNNRSSTDTTQNKISEMSHEL